RSPAGDHSLLPPRQRLVHVSSFQYPKTAYVLLGFEVRPVSDDHCTVRLPSQRLRAAGRAEAAGEKPGAGSFHLYIEHVDIAGHRFALGRRVVVFGVVNRDQILRHNFSFYPVTILERSIVSPSPCRPMARLEFDKSFKKNCLTPTEAPPA